MVYRFDPSEVSFFPPCVLKTLTGYDCPGCGVTRATHSLLHGDLAGVWHYNPALFVGVPLIFFLFAGAASPRGSLLRRIVEWRYLSVVVLVALVAWWILRNVYHI